MKTVERLGADMSVCLSIFARNQSCRVRRRAIVLYLGIFVGFDVGLPAASYTAAQAADAILSQPWGQVPSSKTPAGQATTRFDWTGLYFGGHVGYSRGSSQVALGDPDPTSFRNSFGSLGAGVQAGYNRVLPSRLLLGVEADLSVLNYLSGDDLAWSRTTPDTDLAEKIELMGTLRGRVGYAFDHWMVYATGGLAWALGRFLQTPGVVDDTDRVLHLHTGWSVGAGTEVAIAPSWALRLEYLYRNFGQCRRRIPLGHDGRLGLRRPHCPRGTELQDRATRRKRVGRQLRRRFANPVRQLGDPRPDHLHPAGLPGLPFAICRDEQFHAVGPDAADLDH